MKKRVLAVSAVALGMFILTQGVREGRDSYNSGVNDSVGFTMNSFELVSDDSLVSLSLRYPVVDDRSESLTKILNDSYEAIIFTLLFQGYREGALLEDQLRNHFADLVADHAALNSSAPWSLCEEVNVVHNRSGVLSTRFSVEQYTGGAHGSHSILYISTKYKNGIEEITLSELFSPEGRKEVRRLGEKQFRQVRNLPENADLEREGFWFKNGVFTLTDNFAIVPEGLAFHYNSYTIAPYAMGETALLIPFDSFAPFLEPKKSRYWGL